MTDGVDTGMDQPSSESDGALLRTAVASAEVSTINAASQAVNSDDRSDYPGRWDEIRDRINGLDGQIQKLIGIVDDSNGAQPAAEELSQRHHEIETAIKQLDNSMEKLRRNVESVSRQIVATGETLLGDLKENDAQILLHLKDHSDRVHDGTREISRQLTDLPLGELTEEERTKLADIVCQKLESSLKLTLLGRRKLKKTGELVPAYPDVEAMVRSQVETPLKDLNGTVGTFEKKLTSVIAETLNTYFHQRLSQEHKLVSVVAETVADSLGSARSRGKDDRQPVLSLNLPALAAFVENLRHGPALNVVKHLPEVFNRIEGDLKHQQEELKRTGGESADRAAVELLQAVDDYFINWQRQNNIVRFPEKTGEAIIPRLHEIVLTMPTENSELHRLIGRVEQHGYLLREGEGEVILQKAEVAVWDFGKRE
jgi:molecular chaperone GrpE (heat shock protein)